MTDWELDPRWQELVTIPRSGEGHDVRLFVWRVPEGEPAPAALAGLAGAYRCVSDGAGFDFVVNQAVDSEALALRVAAAIASGQIAFGWKRLPSAKVPPGR